MWACMLRILIREGTHVQGSGTLFKAVDHGVHHFGSNTCVTPPSWAIVLSPGKIILFSLYLNPPNLLGNVIYQLISPLLATQLQRMQRLYFTSRSPIDQNLALKEAVYLIFDTYFHLRCHPNNIIGT